MVSFESTQKGDAVYEDGLTVGRGNDRSTARFNSQS
jgi:hypothetical protein